MPPNRAAAGPPSHQAGAPVAGCHTRCSRTLSRAALFAVCRVERVGVADEASPWYGAGHGVVNPGWIPKIERPGLL